MLMALLTAGCAERTAGLDPIDGGRDAGADLAAADRGADDADADASADLDPPDAASDAAPDATTPDAAPDAAALCPIAAAPPPGPATLRDAPLTAEIPLGAPPGPDALRALDLDGDATPELVIARGGRLEAYDPRGPGRWRTPVFDLDRVIDARDLDGDGRLEVIAAAARAVHVFDALTGDERWRTPDAPFGDDRRLTAVQRVDLLDLDGDGLAELHLTDGGCGDEGTGRGAVFRFAADFGQPLALIAGPRTNGRCGRWQSFTATEPPALLVTDADGIAAFDPLTGQRRRCGDFEAPPNGPLPHLAAGDVRFAFLPDAVLVLEATPDAGPDCPDGRLAVRHRFPLATTPAGSAALDGDPPALLTSAYDPSTGRWQLHHLTADGAATRLHDDARLIALVPGTSTAIVALAEPATPARFGALMALDLTADPPAPLWPLPIPRARLVLDPRARPDHLPDFAPPLTLGPDLLLLRTPLEDGAPTGLADRLERVDLAGHRIAALPLGGDPGALVPAPDGLAIGLPDGTVALLDPTLTPRHPPLPAPAGAATLALGDALYAATPAGLVARLDPPAERPRWQVALGVPARGPSALTPLPAGVLARDPRAGDAAWTLLDATTGAPRWRHRLDPDRYRPIGDAVLAGDTLARADLVLRPAEWPDPLDCATEHTEADPAAPAPDCPATEVRPRVIRGLDPHTGACRWRLVLRPHFPCGGPANQTLSAADADADGQPELYLTETDAIRRIDPATGALTATVPLGRHDTGAIRGGGWLHAADRLLIRAGGNAPVEAYEADLTPRWQAPNPQGLRLQGWIGRDAHLHAGAIWTTPAAGYPLVRYHPHDGAPLTATGLLAGAALADAPLQPTHADLRALVPLQDLDGAPGALAVADDGWLYALDATGALTWSRPHPARIGPPIVTPDPALIVPAADGRVLVYTPHGPPPPPAAWDLPCPPARSCDPADDIDTTRATDRLCAAWAPIEGAAAYEARVTGPGGAILRDWHPATAPARITDLPLAPGARYAIEVRARAPDDRRSPPSATDGLEVIDPTAPHVELTAAPAALTPAEQPVLLTLRAHDDERLAGWRLDVLTPAGAPLRRLAGGPLATRAFATEARWDLTDRAKQPVPPGDYRVIAAVVDRAGNTTRAEAPVTVCAEACP